MTTPTDPTTSPATGPAATAPAPADQRPADATQKVTDRKAPVSTGGFEDAPAEREAADEASSLHSDPATARDWLRAALAAIRAYWVPPALLTEPPASLAELAGYAKAGAWTKRRSGFIRGCGVWWYRLVALPVTAVCRYIEWICQRPGRALPVFLLWKLLITTGPGPWLAAHFIHPLLGLAAWVLL